MNGRSSSESPEIAPLADGAARAPTARRAWRGARRLVLLVALTAVLVPCHLLRGLVPAGGATRTERGRAVVRLWCRLTCRILGLEAVVRGAPGTAPPGVSTLYIANHVSYLDVLLLGGLLDATFVAKSEVARWPVIGSLARLGGVVFVRRARISEAPAQVEALRRLLGEGRSVMLFPEGTSSDGLDVLPFKSTLFQAAVRAEGEPRFSGAVVPVTIRYLLDADRARLSPFDRRALAWYGDAEFLPHFLRLLGLRGAVAEVHMLAPVRVGAHQGRKPLRARCESLVRCALGEEAGAGVA